MNPVEATQQARPDTPSRVPGAEPTVGTAPIVPDYDLLRRIGGGSYGEVWLARSRATGILRAAKIVWRRTFQDDRPFLRELAGIRRFERVSSEHPSQMALFHVSCNEDQGYFCYLMELADDVTGNPLQVPGEPAAASALASGKFENGLLDSYQPRTLRAELAKGRLPAARALEIALALSEALVHLHGRGLVHRDIKPSNVIFVNGRPKLADIGLVTDESDTCSLVGTEGYLPPDGGGTTQADLFALGKVLYEAATGSDRNEFPKLPKELRLWPDAAGVFELNEVCLKACSSKLLEPCKRYETAREIQADLALLQSGKSVIRLRAIERRLARLTHFSYATAGLLMLAGAAYIGSLRQARRADALAEAEFQQRTRAEAALDKMQFARAEEMFVADDSHRALAYLADTIRRNPTNVVAVDRLLSALTQRSFALPRIPPLQHKGRLWKATFINDDRILTASEDGTARVWDTRTGRSVLGPLQHGSPVYAADCSPDGRWIATASKNQSVQIWNARTGALEKTLQAGVAHSVRFSPDNRWLAAGCWGCCAQVWDTATGRLVSTLPHRGPVGSAEFSPDSTRLVTASDDHKVGLWNPATGEAVCPALEHPSALRTAHFDLTGTRILTACADGAVRLWNITNRTCLIMRHRQDVLGAKFSPDNSKLVSYSVDHTARVWNADTGELVGEPLRHSARLNDATFSPDDACIATVSDDGTARVWDVATGRPLIEPIKNTSWLWSVEFSSDGSTLLTSGGGTVNLWDIRPRQAEGQTLATAHWVNLVKFSSDNQRAFIAGEDGRIQIWHCATGRELKSFPAHQGRIMAMRLSPDEKLLATASVDKTACVWDVETGAAVTPRLSHNDHITSVSFSPDGQLVLTGSKDGSACLWNRHSAGRLFDLRHGGAVTSTQFSPAGDRVLTASLDGAARVWDVRSGDPLVGPIGHPAPVYSAAFDPDGLRIATACKDGSIYLWSALTGAPLLPPMKHAQPVRFVLWSPDGRRIVTGSDDNTVRIWNADTGAPAAPPLLHPSAPSAAAFTLDGQRLVTVNWAGTPRVWDTASGQSLCEPWPSSHAASCAAFSSDGRWLLVGYHQRAVIHEVPAFSTAAPVWLPELAEALAGERVNNEVDLCEVPMETLFQLKEALSQSTAADPYTRWAKWFFADPAQRAGSPNSMPTTD